jgi:hypothetical protein
MPCVDMLIDTQYCELVRPSCQHNLFLSHLYGPLNNFRMFCHYAEQLVIAELRPGGKLPRRL